MNFCSDCGNDLRVLVVDYLTGDANMTLAIVAFGYLFYNGIAAVRTKIHEKLRKL